MKSFSPATEQEWLALRANDLTSTEISALFNSSPYTTAFELWHQKRSNTISTLEPSERMRWGLRLQNSIAAGVAEEQGWTLKPLDRFLYMRDEEARLGASFDFEFTAKDGSKGLLEVKNVDGLAYLNGWIENEDGSLEAPVHIEFQVQQQLMLSGHSQAYIAALVGGNRLELVRREPDAGVHAAIRAKASEFWKSVETGIEPVPDFAKDAEFISKLYRYAEPGKLINAAGRVQELAVAYREASKAEKEAEGRKDAAKAEILTLIGDAEKVLGEGFSITAGLVGPTRVEFDRKGYRNFRVNWKKSAIAGQGKGI